MKIRNATRRPIKLRSVQSSRVVDADSDDSVLDAVRDIQVRRDSMTADLEIFLAARSLDGGDDDETVQDMLGGGDDDETVQDMLGGGDDDETVQDMLGGGDDDETLQDMLGDGDDALKGSRANMLRNSTGGPLTVLIERTLPANEAFRLLGKIATLEVQGTDGVEIVIRSRR